MNVMLVLHYKRMFSDFLEGVTSKKLHSLRSDNAPERIASGICKIYVHLQGGILVFAHSYRAYFREVLHTKLRYDKI